MSAHLNKAVFSINIMMLVIRKQHVNHYCIPTMIQRQSIMFFLIYFFIFFYFIITASKLKSSLCYNRIMLYRETIKNEAKRATRVI